MLCPIENNSNAIECTVHTSCYWVLDLLCVFKVKITQSFLLSIANEFDI